MNQVLRSLAIGFALSLSAWAQAQTLDFDSQCASPPCAAGSLYAPAGVTISPGGLTVVAGGTNGLTGTSGGAYLSVDAFPYQVQFTLARTATFFSAVLSLANTATANPVTVAVTPLKAGLPVASAINVTLTSVNTWSPVVIDIPTGFDAIFMDPGSGGGDLTYGIDSVQIAGNCFGFSDVTPTDSYCGAVEWLGNRGITLGCALGAFCPADNVTRAQMALFMNRLGNALVPLPIVVSGSGASLDADAGNILCQTADLDIGTYPKRSLIIGEFSGVSTGGSLTTYALTVYSVDGGNQWFTPYALGDWTQVGTSAAGNSLFASQALIRRFDAGTRVRYGVYIARVSGAGTGQIGNWTCKLNLLMHSAVPVSATAPKVAAPEPEGVRVNR